MSPRNETLSKKDKARLLEVGILEMTYQGAARLRRAAWLIEKNDREAARMSLDLAADLSSGESLTAVLRALREMQEGE